MKLVKIFENALNTPKKLKLDVLKKKYKYYEDDWYDYTGNQELSATLIKDDNEEIRYVSVSIIENGMNIHGKSNDNRYDKITGFYKANWDVVMKDDEVIDYRLIPEKDVFFIFDLTKEFDRVKKNALIELCKRKRIPRGYFDGLEGYDDEDFEDLNDHEIRYQGLHEVIVIDRMYLSFKKTIKK
jgi:hypothetical protein